MRLFDFIVSVIGICILSPLFIISVLLIRLTSPGPIFYIQDRVGKCCRIFRFYKFRSMVINADSMGTSVTSGNDPRITRIGKVLRKTKLDELPQLWNVLKGDMSFVGPRPDVPEIVNNYTDEMKMILDVRPGITSNASLYLKNEEDLLSLAIDHDSAYEEIFVPAKVKLALEHVNRNSFIFDFVILLKTVWYLTVGKVYPTKENKIIIEIKKNIEMSNKKIIWQLPPVTGMERVIKENIIQIN